MNVIWKILLIILIIVGLSVLILIAGQARQFTSLTNPPIPQGFNLIDQATGVTLFRKDYKNGTPDFVQMVDFNQGAEVKLLYGKVTTERAGKGAYGGDDTQILSQSLSTYWNKISSKNENAFCVTNGQFFYMPESPTRLSFPLKVDGKILTEGYAANEFSGQKLMLEIWSDHVDIRELNRESLYQSSAPNIICGLNADANKRIKQSVGRTFVGVDDQNGDGMYETVFIFNTRTALQSEAEAVLKNFGAEKVMMLDGGGSTQLICEGNPVIYSERLIPQAIAVISGSEKQNNQLADVQKQEVQSSIPEPSEKFENNQPAQMSIQNTEISKDNVNVPVEQVQNSNSNLEDTVWIPTCIIPVALFIFFFAMKIRNQNY